MNKLFVDPSGTGTTGICLVKNEIIFQQFKNPNWKEHFSWIKDLVVENSVELIVHEGSSFVPSRDKNISSLFRLFGAIETLTCSFSNLKIETIPSTHTKTLRKQIINKQKRIAGLNYQRGKNWTYQGQSISGHQLDAFLVYWIWRGNNHLN